MSAINNRYEFVYLFDVENGNPNGDPDAGNLPRIDPETSHGLVTDVCLKRKIRNYVELAREGAQRYWIFIQEKAVLNDLLTKAHEAVAPPVEDGEKEKKKDKQAKEKLAQQWMCENYYDVRAFGAVMSTGDYGCGQVRGPVQLNFARSIDPVLPLDVTITRMAVTNEKDRDSERTMGRKSIIPYGLYRAEGYISASFAANTGFSDDDLALLWEALANMFDHDHSAARGKMTARRLVIFKHDSKLGNAQAHRLFDLVKVTRKDTSTPVRAYDDYTVEVGMAPAGVSMDDLVL